MTAVIEMTSITKDFVVGDITMHVLKSINLSIDKGEFVAIMGPSGSGKSTMMNVLGLLDRPTGGQYLLDDIETLPLSDPDLAHLRNRKIGFVFQGFNLLARRNTLENIALPMCYNGVSRRERMAQAEKYLDRVGLSSHRHHTPTQMSGGQQQRVAIARALVMEPSIILADEPTGNLDSKTSDEIMNLFKDLNAQGITIILVTHEQDVAQYAQRLVHLKDGEIIYDGPMY